LYRSWDILWLGRDILCAERIYYSDNISYYLEICICCIEAGIYCITDIGHDILCAEGIYNSNDNMSYPIEARIYQTELDILYRS
jgi:hypothetical protein